jgi:hypothetical protein
MPCDNIIADKAVVVLSYVVSFTVVLSHDTSYIYQAIPSIIIHTKYHKWYWCISELGVCLVISCYQLSYTGTN